MEKSDSQRMVEAFYYVRDVYRNISRMLLSCDPLMEEKGFTTNPVWKSVWPDRTLALAPGNISDSWMPYYAVRQYYKVDDPLDFITIGAVVWDYFRREFDTPLCLASRMLVHDSYPNALIWIGVIQMWDNTAKPDGEVRLLSEASSNLTDNYRKEIAQHVRGGRILSVACPLLEVCDTNVIESRLINPLLRRGLTELPPPPPPPRQIEWDKESFFQRLKATGDSTEVEGAIQIVALAEEQGLTPCWMGGQWGGVFRPMLVQGEKKLWPLSLDTEGHLTLRMEQLTQHQPFDDATKRSELQERLSKIPGVNVSGESWAVPVNIPRSALAQNETFQELLSVVKWLIDQITHSGQVVPR